MSGVSAQWAVLGRTGKLRLPMAPGDKSLPAQDLTTSLRRMTTSRSSPFRRSAPLDLAGRTIAHGREEIPFCLLGFGHECEQGFQSQSLRLVLEVLDEIGDPILTRRIPKSTSNLAAYRSASLLDHP